MLMNSWKSKENRAKIRVGPGVRSYLTPPPTPDEVKAAVKEYLTPPPTPDEVKAAVKEYLSGGGKITHYERVAGEDVIVS